jgi:radical SAM superfamily enzyme YgiQ (UPF0313 family)
MKNKVLLIYPPLYYSMGLPQSLDVSSPPLGLLYLAAVLEREGIAVKFLDIGAENLSIQETLRFISEEGFGIVGISAMTPQLQGAVTLAEAIKGEFGVKVIIGLGGAHFSSNPDFINRFECFDFGITGEAETVFPVILKDIFSGAKVQRIYRGTPVDDLDRIPLPARHLAKAKYPQLGSLIFSRGCPYSCFYCSRPAISNIVRYRNPSSVVDEIGMLRGRYKGRFQFQDDAFTINKEYSMSLCAELIKRKVKVQWAAYTRVDLVDEETVKIMASAGCKRIIFGIESGNEAIRNQVIGKKFSNEQIKKALFLCRKYNIERGGFFMIGIPGEGKNEVIETTDFMLKNDFDIVSLSIATPLPASNLWKSAEAKGIINNDFLEKFARGQLGAGYSGVYPVYSDENIPLQWLYEQRKNTLRRFYLRPRIILNRAFRDMGNIAELKSDLWQGLNVLFRGTSSRSPYQRETKRCYI